MNKQEKSVEFLKEAETHLKQAQAQTASPGVQITSISIDGCRVAGFPIALRTIGDDTVVVRADVQLSRTDIRESLKFVQGIRAELEKPNQDEKKLRNAFIFYRDKVPPQIFRAVSSAIVTSGLDKVVW
jgi:hypothetical protein